MSHETMDLTHEQVSAACGGRWLSLQQTNFDSVGTDSRSSLRGQIFFALKGERFDAHDFLAQAVAQGAAALVVDRPPASEIVQKVSVYLVSDTLAALQSLAHWWRHKQKALIIGITGSNGKTTTKKIAAHLLGERFETLASPGSFNNHWGVPLTILQIRPRHEAAILEMGMNHAGEIRKLCEIADPDLVTVTMVGRAHIENFGSIDGIAQAKQEIYKHAPAGARAIFNLDDVRTRPMLEAWRSSRPEAEFLTFSGQLNSGADVELIADQTSSDQELVFHGTIGGLRGQSSVALFGEHNMVNVRAASALAIASGVAPEIIWQGFAKVGGAWGRNQWLRLNSGTQILFDAYNANPDSMAALLANLVRSERSGRKFAVLGEMLELGPLTTAEHRRLGELAGQTGFAGIYFIGPSSAEFAAGLKSAGYKNKLMTSNTYEQILANELLSMLHPDDLVVMKASRGIRLEQVLKNWSVVNFSESKD